MAERQQPYPIFNDSIPKPSYFLISSFVSFFFHRQFSNFTIKVYKVIFRTI